MYKRQPLPRPAAAPLAQLDGCNIPVIAAWPGADDALVDAVAASRPDGIVVAALGAGNVSEQMGTGLARALDAGIPVVISTSVPRGEVAFAYGGAGGGSTLGAKGALPAGFLRPGQARMALATALAAGVDPAPLLGAR